MSTLYLRLAKPIFITFSYDGDIEREEVISDVAVEPREAGAPIDPNEMFASMDLIDRIDQKATPVTCEQLARYNAIGAIRDAYWSASRRASDYADAKADQLARAESRRAKARGMSAAETDELRRS